ncbi:MAG: UPF0149 family protein [Bradyrhizobium sp.]|nr:UPF0149 family protein [Bradyrhizobium sp.]
MLVSALAHREELLALGDEAMLLEEIDGFIAGLLACPELPSDWLPVVWHDDSSVVAHRISHPSHHGTSWVGSFRSVARWPSACGSYCKAV